MIKIKNIKINNRRATFEEEKIIETYLIDCLQKNKEITLFDIKTQ
jgi:hypothetical protein